jgi:riboflavin synthase alpha subunit
MKKRYSITRDSEGRWVTINEATHRATKSFKTKSEAVKAGRSIARSGTTVIVHDSKGRVNEVLLPQRKSNSVKLLEARVKRSRSNNEVNIAIAKAMDKGRK